jgi:hypothetical protein
VTGMDPFGGVTAAEFAETIRRNALAAFGPGLSTGEVGAVTGMDELVRWLLEQLDDDERVAQRVEPTQAPLDLRAMVTREGSDPFLVIDSARALAEVDAKRRMIDVHRPTMTEQYGEPFPQCMTCGTWPCTTIRLLALPYADRVGYREAWCP